jgi:hypothetical protein
VAIKDGPVTGNRLRKVVANAIFKPRLTEGDIEF